MREEPDRDAADGDGLPNASAAERVFATFLERYYADEPVTFASVCDEHPGLVEELKRLHDRWLAVIGQLEQDESSSADAAALSPLQESDVRPASEILARLRQRSAAADRYRTRGEIARGGMGTVLNVWDEDLRRSLAMKVLRARLDGDGPNGADEKLVARFLEEAQVTSQLHHPGIVPVHEIGLDHEGRLYFTMQLVRGSTFRVVISAARRQAERWSLTRALGVVIKVCEAMAYAHARGVIHRDLKPDNIMVGNYGETYVMDWGLARVHGAAADKVVPAPESSIQTLRGDQRAADVESPVLTLRGAAIGTPSYMAPEQATGLTRQIGPAVDVYSVGAILYHLLCGHMPYTAPSACVSQEQVLKTLLIRPPQPLLELDPDAPPELVAICEKAMQRDPDARYRDMAAMAEDLRAFLDKRVVKAHRIGPIVELRKWVARNRLVAAIGLLALISLFVVQALGTRAAIAERRRADQAADRARQVSRELAVQLSRSRIEGGRTLGRLGDAATGERMLWRELLTLDQQDVGESRAELESLARWAMWEFYSQWPCLASRGGFSTGSDVGFLKVPSAVVVLSRDGLRLCSQRDLSHVPIPSTVSAATWTGRLSEDATSYVELDGTTLRVRRVPSGEVLGETQLPDRSPVPPTCTDWRDNVLVVMGERGRLWDTVTMRSIDEGMDLNGWLAVISRDLLAVRSRSELRFLSLADGQLLGRINISPTGGRIAADPTGTMIAAHDRMHIELRSVPTGHLLDRWQAHASYISDLSFSGSGEMLVSASNDRSVRLWRIPCGDAAPHEPLTDLRGHDAVVVRAVVARDGSTVASLDQRGTLKLWETSPAAAFGVVPNGRASPFLASAHCIRFTRDGALVAISGRVDVESAEQAAALRGGIQVCDVRTRRSRWRAHHPTGLLSALRFTCDEQRLAASSYDGSVVSYETAHGARAGEVAVPPEVASVARQLTSLAGSDAGDLAAGGNDGSVWWWEPGGAVPRIVDRHSARVCYVDMTSTGDRLASGTFRGVLRVLARNGDHSWRVLAHADEGSAVRIVRFSADGTLLGWAGENRLVTVMDLSKQTRCIFRGHQAAVLALALSRDGRMLASGDQVGEVKLWDMVSGYNLATLRPAGASLRLCLSLDFSPDGRLLGAAYSDGVAGLWDLAHYDQHIAGNRAYQQELLDAESLGEGH